MRKDQNAVDDPLLRQAVLDLFRANQEFRAAYQDFERTGDADRIRDAGSRIDAARDRVASAQSLRR